MRIEKISRIESKWLLNICSNGLEVRNVSKEETIDGFIRNR